MAGFHLFVEGATPVPLPIHVKVRLDCAFHAYGHLRQREAPTGGVALAFGRRVSARRWSYLRTGDTCTVNGLLDQPGRFGLFEKSPNVREEVRPPLGGACH